MNRDELEALCERGDELVKAITEGPEAVRREFVMRIPAEPMRDADLVFSSLIAEIRRLVEGLEEIAKIAPDYTGACANIARKLLEGDDGKD